MKDDRLAEHYRWCAINSRCTICGTHWLYAWARPQDWICGTCQYGIAEHAAKEERKAKREERKAKLRAATVITKEEKHQ